MNVRILMIVAICCICVYSGELTHAAEPDINVSLFVRDQQLKAGEAVALVVELINTRPTEVVINMPVDFRADLYVPGKGDPPPLPEVKNPIGGARLILRCFVPRPGKLEVIHRVFRPGRFTLAPEEQKLIRVDVPPDYLTLGACHFQLVVFEGNREIGRSNGVAVQVVPKGN